MPKRLIIIALAACIVTTAKSTTRIIDVPDASTWSNTAISTINNGDTVLFNAPVLVCRNWGYGGFYGLQMSVRRVYSPTNQALPKSQEYYQQIALNNSALFTLVGAGYHRNGERLNNLKAVKSGNLELTFISGNWEGNNTRNAIRHTLPDVDMQANHDLLVCAANLEYYLVENLGTGYGPDNQTEHNRQRTKVIAALAEIAADLYGLVEIEQGQAALEEIATYLSQETGFSYTWIDDHGSANGSYTKSGYVYRMDKLAPIGALRNNNTVVQNRKKIQAFRVIDSGETFVYSINHFKAKSGTGYGLDADQGDGQGIFNNSRKREAENILTNMPTYCAIDKDFLMMGDLNAYAKEDPIQTLVNGGLTDLHRYFHADSSYSYQYGAEAGYLDHALCNSTMLAQVTGLGVWHVNSDESDEYTYDKSSDITPFRYSDHDPVLVGLHLDSTLSITPTIDNTQIELVGGDLCITNAYGNDKSFYELYTISGTKVIGYTPITQDNMPINHQLAAGVYILKIYYAETTKVFRIFIH